MFIYKYFTQEGNRDNFISGNIYFKNLEYFSKLENDQRADIQEGLISDKPKPEITEITIQMPDGQTYTCPTNTKFEATNNYANRKNSWICCFSYDCKEELFRKFGNYCLKINKQLFLECINTFFDSHFKQKDVNFVRGKDVIYYDEQSSNSNYDAYRKVHTNLCFAKTKKYEDENEYRLNFYYDISHIDEKQSLIIVPIGNISDIVEKIITVNKNAT